MFQFKVNQFLPGQRAEHPLALAVVVPTFNERDNLGVLVPRLRAALSDIPSEIIFVDDNSADGTADIIAEIARYDPSIRIIRRVGRRGLSTAVLEGMLSSAADFFLVIDADLQHDETVIPAMFDALVSNRADVVVGTRYANGGSVTDWAKTRFNASRFATHLARTFLRTELSDPMSGFFAIRREALMNALPRLSGTGYKILLDITASSPLPLRTLEIPYRFQSRIAGESKLDSTIILEYGQLLLEKTVGRYIPIRLLMFLCVGLFGLAIHLTLLALALGALLPFQIAQAGAVIGSMTGNFFLNNLFTYRDRRLHGWRAVRGLLSFYLVCSVGALANVGAGSYFYKMGEVWWLAGIAGAAVGSIWNFSASALFTWKRS